MNVDEIQVGEASGILFSSSVVRAELKNGLLGLEWMFNYSFSEVFIVFLSLLFILESGCVQTQL